jgi:hypothetical protein
VNDLATAIISGLLSGGIAGAVLGGIISVRLQSRAFEHEERLRFLDLKRKRYSTLLRIADDWVRTLEHHLDIYGSISSKPDKSIPRLPPTTTIEQLTNEIDLLAPSVVGGAALELCASVLLLGAYSDAGTPAELIMAKQLIPLGPALAGYRLHRSEFVNAAKNDLGTGR